jgi:hypothetical protein
VEDKREFYNEECVTCWTETVYSKPSSVRINWGRGRPDLSIIRINEAKDSPKRKKKEIWKINTWKI